MLWETIKAFHTQLDIEVDRVLSLACTFFRIEKQKVETSKTNWGTSDANRDALQLYCSSWWVNETREPGHILWPDCPTE